MTRPLRENLVVHDEDGQSWVRCAKCSQTLSLADQDWKAGCRVVVTSPTTAGPHRQVMLGKIAFEERYCPGCGTLLDVAFLEVSRMANEQGMAALAQQSEPSPVQVTLPSESTAVLVLDIGMRALDAEEAANNLLEPVSALLGRARDKGVYVAYTIMVQDEGTPMGAVATPLRRREEEPVLYPLGYDKLRNGELAKLLDERGIEHVIAVGASTHLCVLYTCTAAARNHGYHVVVPLDGVAAKNPYEHEYSLHQLTVLPALPLQIDFTETALIEFR